MRITSMIVLAAVAGNLGLLGTAAYSFGSEAKRDAILTRVEKIRNEKEIVENLPWLVATYRNTKDEGVASVIGEKFKSIPTVEGKAGLIGLIEDPKVNDGVNGPMVWVALAAHGRLLSEDEVLKLLAKYSESDPAGVFVVAGLSNIGPKTREVVLKEMDSKSVHQRTWAITFMRIQLGLEKRKPVSLPSGEERKTMCDLLAVEADRLLDLSYFAGILLLEAGDFRGALGVCAGIQKDLKRIEKKQRSFDDVRGSIDNVQEITKHSFYENWPAEESEKETIALKACEWLKEKRRSAGDGAKSPPAEKSDQK